MGAGPATGPHTGRKGTNVKVRNAGTNNYIGAGLVVNPGEVVDVKDETAAYLLSDACPGKFEAVVAEAPKAQAAKPGKK